MNRIFLLAWIAPVLLVSSCASHKSSDTANSTASDGAAVPYQPATKAEQVEFANDRLDFYPDDYRKDPEAHSNTIVAWAGVIVSTDANEKDTGDKIFADTVFEQHYFDWVQDGTGKNCKLSVSPRGEGRFRTRWILDKMSPETTPDNAEQYAAPGNLVIFYGIPEKVETNGTILMRYRYLRMFDKDHFTTNEYDYGRLGEPFHTIHRQTMAGVPAR